ncbi:MAG: hypothetical protein AAFX53_13190 [Bacteroidota bacterium]
MWFIVALALSCSSTKRIKTLNSIAEMGYLNINGTEQYVPIRGENKDNPILLFNKALRSIGRLINHRRIRLNGMA